MYQVSMIDRPYRTGGVTFESHFIDIESTNITIRMDYDNAELIYNWMIDLPTNVNFFHIFATDIRDGSLVHNYENVLALRPFLSHNIGVLEGSIIPKKVIGGDDLFGDWKRLGF